MSKKEIRLTNWQVPRDPKLARFEALNAAPPIDMKNYENVGSVEHHDSVESVTNKMIAEKEAQIGRKIDQAAPPKGSNLSMNGINDTRPDRKMWTWRPGDPIKTFNAKRGAGENE